jgi:hypothetical protein
MPRNWPFVSWPHKFNILYGTLAPVSYVSTPQFGTVVTRKMAGLVQYRSYVLYNRCDDCEYCILEFNRMTLSGPSETGF